MTTTAGSPALRASSTAALPIVICGGGIGGLTLAVALQQHGLPAHVFERAPTLAPAGAGITIQVNAMRVFERLGLAAAVAAAGEVLSGGAIRTPEGRVLRRLYQESLARRYGVPSVAIHRARLQELLAAALAPGTLVMGREVAGVDAPAEAAEAAVVRFADGSTLAADLVVGADGLHSAVRASLFGARGDALREAGQISWRGVCGRDAAAGAEGGETWGPGARFGFIAISRTETYWFAVLDTARSPAPEISQREALLAAFAGWHAPIAALVQATAPASIIRTPLRDRVPSDVWGRGVITLLGDAAHPMTPNLGQGGCQAIEDAWVLAAALAASAGAPALRAYEAERRDRTRRFVEESWRMGRLAQATNPVVRSGRNLLMRALPDRWVESALSWAYAFDPDATLR